MPGATLNYDTLTQVNGAVGSGAMPPLIVQMHIKARRYQGSTSATLVALAYGVAANHWKCRYTFCIFLLEIFGAKMMLLVLDAIGFLMFLVGLLAFLASQCTFFCIFPRCRSLTNRLWRLFCLQKLCGCFSMPMDESSWRTRPMYLCHGPILTGWPPTLAALLRGFTRVSQISR